MADSKAVRTTPIAGVVGLGQIGIQHAAILSFLTQHRVCVTDSSARLLSIAATFANNLCPHPTVDDLANHGVTAIFICTPAQSHAGLVRRIMSNSSDEVGVFVEKPLASNYDSASEALRDAGVRRMTMVGFQKRFNGVYTTLKGLVDKKAFGEVRFYRAHSFSFDVPHTTKGWKFELPDGGATLEFGAHLLDMLIWIFGEPKIRAASLSRLFSKEVEDYSQVTLDHNGVFGSVEIGWSMRNYIPNEHYIELHGTSGTAIATDDQLVLHLERPVEGVAGIGSHVLHTYDLTPKVPYLFTLPEYVLEDQYFLNSVHKHVFPQPDFSQGVKVNKLADAMRLHRNME
jgi:predicted dehydrogenase